MRWFVLLLMIWGIVLGQVRYFDSIVDVLPAQVQILREAHPIADQFVSPQQFVLRAKRLIIGYATIISVGMLCVRYLPPRFRNSNKYIKRYFIENDSVALRRKLANSFAPVGFLAMCLVSTANINRTFNALYPETNWNLLFVPLVLGGVAVLLIVTFRMAPVYMPTDKYAPWRTPLPSQSNSE